MDRRVFVSSVERDNKVIPMTAWGAMISKGIIMAILTLSVIPSHGLSDFLKALIITSVGATLTGVFTIIGAIIGTRIAAKQTKPIAESVEHIQRKVGAANRETDS